MAQPECPDPDPIHLAGDREADHSRSAENLRQAPDWLKGKSSHPFDLLTAERDLLTGKISQAQFNARCEEERNRGIEDWVCETTITALATRLLAPRPPWSKTRLFGRYAPTRVSGTRII